MWIACNITLRKNIVAHASCEMVHTFHTSNPAPLLSEKIESYVCASLCATSIASSIARKRFKEWNARTHPIKRMDDAIMSTRAVRWTFTVSLVAIGASGSATLFMASLPDISDPNVWKSSSSIVIRDRNRQEIYYSYQDIDRVWLRKGEIPEHVKNAFIAIEDERFWDRGCIDWRALGRAAWANLSDFKSQGASTITQQLVRTALLNREKTFSRKAKELALACELEGALSREDILHLYLNWIPFGGGIAGIQQASTHFFGKDAQDLSVAEAAILASLPQRPSYFSPYGEHLTTALTQTGHLMLASGSYLSVSDIPEEDIIIGLTGTSALVKDGTRAVFIGGRANQVLQNMEEMGYITQEQVFEANSDLHHLRFRPNVRSIEAPHYVFNVLQQAQQIPHEENDQLYIDTTIDIGLQHQVENIVQNYSSTVSNKFGAQNIAVVIADIDTREILAYVGNTDYFSLDNGSKVDMAQAPRQPGSSFKPIVYAAAMIQSGWDPSTVIYDVPIEKNGIRPKNYDNKFRGRMSLIQALNESRNIPAIKAYDAAKSEENILNLAQQIGITEPSIARAKREQEYGSYSYSWPLAIGTAETPLIQMVEAYATFADHGKHKNMQWIRVAWNGDGDELYRQEDNGAQAMPIHIAEELTAMLAETRARPAGYWRDKTDLPSVHEAVKTGTSNVCIERNKTRCTNMLPRDLWAIGYTPQYVAGVWVGNTDGTPLAINANGLEAAVPIWRDVLTTMHQSNLAAGARTEFVNASRPYYDQRPELLRPWRNPNSQPPSLISGRGEQVPNAVELREWERMIERIRRR